MDSFIEKTNILLMMLHKNKYNNKNQQATKDRILLKMKVLRIKIKMISNKLRELKFDYICFNYFNEHNNSLTIHLPSNSILFKEFISPDQYTFL